MLSGVKLISDDYLIYPADNGTVGSDVFTVPDLSAEPLKESYCPIGFSKISIDNPV